ncbi:sigma 54-interacting transcriptional regulator [Vagococcus salmoninarum]|uniref:sigma 54-interacting transcriptional regulator n=2 Tax=Vagococcus salmoninarum TaxID=2739 RepID=UPI003F968BBC
MNRIDQVEKALKEMYQFNKLGITAEGIANRLGYERSNVSRDLNTLVKGGKCVKKKSRPVLFFPIEETGRRNQKTFNFNSVGQNEIVTNQTELDYFSTANQSLLPQIELGKSAILYPTHLMHILILGDTGVGKSMFAKLLHGYGIEVQRFTERSPFIRFNCADYANSPQLLMAQLFGSVKGAYTGAEENRRGVLEQADGGILFLDEIHRLPIEGQEMLFTYIDQGYFKALGDPLTERFVKVMLIGATTESRDSFSPTFSRRMPMVIRLPNLKERTIEERYLLFEKFTGLEIDKLNLDVKISHNSLKAFLSYECHYNIGQLKSDIRLVFAKAYGDYLTGKNSEVMITSKDLPAHIKDGLFLETIHRQLWQSLNSQSEPFVTLKAKGNPQQQESASIYLEITERVKSLEQSNLSLEAIQNEISKDLSLYMTKYQKYQPNQGDNEVLLSFIPRADLAIIEEMIRFSEAELAYVFSRKVHQALAIHIFNLLERLRKSQDLNYDPSLNYSQEYPELYQTAKDGIAILEERLGIRVPPEEAHYLILFYAYDELNKRFFSENVQVVVIAHGERTGSALSETANSLLGNQGVIGIDAKLDKKPQDIYNQLKEIIVNRQIDQDILLLVDMGSLLTFEKPLMEDFSIKVKAVPLVSTVHVIEASRKAMLGQSLEELYQEMLRINRYMDEFYLKETTSTSTRLSSQSFKMKPLSILAICLTGEGTALTIKSVLENKLGLKEQEIKVLTLSLLTKEGVQKQINKLSQSYRIICIVSTFQIKTEIPSFDLFSLLNGKSLVEITESINQEQIYRQMPEQITNYFDVQQGEVIVMKVFEFIEQLEGQLHLRLNSNQLLTIAFHIMGMVIKDQRQETIPKFISHSPLMQTNQIAVTEIKKLFVNDFGQFFDDLSEDHLNFVAYSVLHQPI